MSRTLAGLCLVVLFAGAVAHLEGPQSLGARADSIFTGDAGLIEKRESQYNTILVHRRDGLMIMSFGYNRRIFTESAYDPTDDLRLPIYYTQVMTVGLAYPSSPARILEIGFGGGRTVSYLHKSMPEAKITSVELDPAVVELAKKHFGVAEDENLKIATKDGRSFLRGAAEKYDLLMIDAYRGPFVPFHLLTKEFYALAKTRLAPGGVLAQNIEPTTMLFDAANATLASAFDNVDLFDARGNIIAIAYDGKPKTNAELKAQAEALQKRHALKYPVTALLPLRRVLKKTDPKRILSDDFAPVEELRAIQLHNRKLSDITETPN
jgi:spermidine synthase